MNLSDKELKTIAYYKEHAQDWAATRGPNTKVSFWMPELTLFQEYLPHGKILEIGFGGAGEAAEFINKGYDYTGIEPAQELVAIAQQKFPNALFLTASIYDFKVPAQSYDGFWCSAVLLHIPKKSIDTALQNIKKALKPHALGFISLAAGDGEYFDEATGRYFYLYQEDEFAALLKHNGFNIESNVIKAQDTHRPWLRTWLTFFVRVSQ